MRETSACDVCVLSAIKRARIRYHNGESNALFFPERDASEESASFTFALSLDDKHSSMAPRTRGRNSSNNNKSSSAEKNEKENEKKKKNIKRKKNEEEEEENNDRLDVEDIAKRVKRASIGKKEEAREEEEKVLRGGSRGAEEARGEEEEEEKVPPSSSSSLSLASYAEINSVLKRLHFEARERRRTSMSP